MEELDSIQEYMKNNKGIKDQMQESKLEYCNNLTLDKLTDFLTSTIDVSLEPERQLHIITGKKGYIDFRYAFCKRVGFNEQELKILTDKLEKELPEGLYKL
jgi:hypothetical protein